jgi:hypothetical protein
MSAEAGGMLDTIGKALTGELDNYGCAILAKLLSPE